MGLRRLGVALALFAALIACDPAAKPADGAPTATAVAPVRVMPLGDSITMGAYSSTGGGYRLPLWRDLQARSVRVDFVGSQSDGSFEDPDHEGHSGYTIDQIRDSVDGWLVQARPDIVLLHLGINDLDRGHSAGASLRLVALVDRIRADRPGTTVIVQGLIPTTAELQQEAQSFNADVRQVAGGHDFTWVEPPVLGAGEMTDQLHPNDLGYQWMANAYAGAMTQSSSPRFQGRSPGCSSVSGG